MSKDFDYTSLAQRYTARFPIATYVGTQINFWMFANILLGLILHLQARAFGEIFGLSGLDKLSPIILTAIILGILYGICLGFADYYLDRHLFKRKPLGKVIVLKTVITLLILTSLLALLRFSLSDVSRLTINYNQTLLLTESTWKYLFFILAIYYFFMTLVINFINQVNKKYGPGILIPLLLGKYRNPKEEERIFMFMDLKSSTSMAEALGHLKYSSFIRDCFMDINLVLNAFNAQVYQYVGDEIVLTWTVSDGLKSFSCIRFFFACEKQFNERKSYYTDQYGSVPHFKAGLHMGSVTVVEIGEIKRDIAYHGDTLNTAARIQSVCNDYGKKLLVSESLLNRIGVHHHLKKESLGNILLKGKTAQVGIANVEWIENNQQL